MANRRAGTAAAFSIVFRPGLGVALDGATIPAHAGSSQVCRRVCMSRYLRRDRMRSTDDADPEACLEEALEGVVYGDTGVSDNQPVARWMTSAPFLVISWPRYSMFPAGTAVAGRKADEFEVTVRVDVEGPLPVAHGPETFAARATPVAVTDDNADFFRRSHAGSPWTRPGCTRKRTACPAPGPWLATPIPHRRLPRRDRRRRENSDARKPRGLTWRSS